MRFTKITTVAFSLMVGLTASALPAQANPPTPTATRSTSGLFGSADPTYDGAYRQSMALLGLTAAKAPLPPSAVSWLVAQQCANGSFQAYRADRTQPCAAPDPTAFSGPDSNSTALAAMALRAAGRKAQAARAVAALLSTQNADGGWGYTLGGTSDVNSTGLALAAVAGQVRTKAAATKATAYLSRAQAPCSSPITSRFGLPYQPGGPVDALSSAQGLIGLSGPLPISPVESPSVRKVTCSSAPSAQLASFLARVLRATNGAIPSVVDSTKTDWNTTATAAIALSAAGGAPRGVTLALAALGQNIVAYTGSGATASPAALGTLIQAAAAGGANPLRFGSARANLVANLLATLQK
ncbi:MAG: prenyltransferase/squalene oxidase repeat-containing protein [Actinomycetota bacterium]|nr:prenyltransferase/squalene oxidase repeat-containing protein [Actinomycetota bacterium]